MAQPYIGEIRMFAGNFPPLGWLFCDGSLQPISEYETLFQLIGTTYGGDGQTTFALPNLAGRVPVHMGTAPSGTTYQIGEMAGTESVTITSSSMPSHNHAFVADAALANVAGPANNYLGQPNQALIFRPDTPPSVTFNPSSIAPTGGSQPHNNMQPFLCISFIISLYGIFPSQT